VESTELRGNFLPKWLNTTVIKPEQSKPSLISLEAYKFGVPIKVFAQFTNSKEFTIKEVNIIGNSERL
jgi:hypothetical protein